MEHYDVAFAVGDVLHDRYRIAGVLGAGGASTTFVAHDALFDTNVALKTVSLSTPELADVLRNEFARLSGLLHPRLTHVLDFGAAKRDQERFLFYTCALIDGTTLDVFARSRHWNEVRHAVADAACALAFLHHAGIRHGDVKPTNILVTPNGRGVLIDLGCARPLPIDGSSSTLRLDEVSGTRDFLAPELLEGHAGDARADLFALGRTITAIRGALVDELPRAIDSLIDRLVESDAKARPTDAIEVAEALGASHAERITARAPLSGEPRHVLGRDAEMRQWRAVLEDLRERRPGTRVVWLAGPHGIGKTRLLREMKWRAQLGYEVVEGSAHVAQPITSLLQRAVRDDPGPSALSHALSAYERLAASSEPLVLVIDDLQAVDANERTILDALLRTTERSSPIVWLLASVDTPTEQLHNAAVVPLGTLGEREVRAWLEPFASAGVYPSVMRATRGTPRLLRDVCARLARGELTETEIERRGDETSLERSALEALKKTSLGTRRALVVIAFFDGYLSAAQISVLALTHTDLADLTREGWIEHDASGARWRAVAEPAAVLASLDSIDRKEVQQAREEVERHLERALRACEASSPAHSAISAHLVRIVAQSNEIERAADMLVRGAELAASSPQAWARAADAVAAVVTAKPEVELARAFVYETAGRAEEALSVLAGILRSRPTGAALLAVRQRAGSCYLKLGQSRRARKQLETALATRNDAAPNAAKDRASIVDLLSRTLIQEGAHRAAMERAAEALSWTSDPGLTAALHENIGVAASFLGDFVTARSHLERAASIAGQGASIRARARVLSYQAILDYREGRTDAAAASYERVLELAEQHGLSDYVASSALNLGTACHQLGDWGRALASYERGLRMAVALGKTSTVAILRWNLAKLYADIGSFERADAALESLHTSPDATKVESLVGAKASLRGEIALARGDVSAAAAHFRDARETYEKQGTHRELVEVVLQSVESSILATDLAAARKALEEIDHVDSGLDAADLRARKALARGRLLLAENEGPDALAALERASTAATISGQRALLAEVEDLLAVACKLTAAPVLQREHASRARALWERIAASLPSALRDSFWRNPRRAHAARFGGVSLEVGLLPTTESSLRETDGDLLSPRLRRLLEINRRLSESLDTENILRLTMDAAVELTGAERGFLILARWRGDTFDETQLDVAVARNMDREKIDKSHLKFSQGIAERVISSGEPLLTVDALEDERFRTHESVHAMRLRSVLSVPIRTSEGVLGALYLDNRFQRGRFREQDSELLLAFADQVAIALRNARLHAELAQRTRELETERKRIERLLRQQTTEIERLSEEVRVRQDALEHKFDYGNIVGRSKPMLAVLAVLDKVIESSLSVLIQGESGTGKELVARAVHFNGPRRKAPFVSVNCAALSDTLLESELFGHVRGAFTGALRDRAGLFVEARGGTLFLDELGEMSPSMQVKLLRVLQEREVRPVGSSEVVAVDVRVVCATNRDIRREVAEGRFREDLYYRVGVVTVTLPSLRERIDDIPELARHLLERIAREQGKTAPRISSSAMRKLVSHTWPGNVRQMENVLAKSFVLARGDVLDPADLDLGPTHTAPATARSRRSYEKNESSLLLETLNHRGWNVSEVARSLGIPRTTLYRKMRKHGLLRTND